MCTSVEASLNKTIFSLHSQKLRSKVHIAKNYNEMDIKKVNKM